MRYSIQGATVQQVKSAGGIDIKEAHTIGIVFATLLPQQVSKLKALGCQVMQIEKVEVTVMPPTPVAAAPVYTPEELVWAAQMESLRALFIPPLYGEGFSIAIIDTGIRETHVGINGRVIYNKNYTTDPMRDGLNHGTGVCSIVSTIAPLCNILNMKVLNDKGEGTEEEVVLAIDDCIALHEEGSFYAPQVINLSLGSPDDGNPNNPLRTACRVAIDRGIWVLASAGNGGPAFGSITSPACEKYVGAVGSCKYEPFQISNFSSRGPTKEGLVKPDALFFGEDVIIASAMSDTATIAKSGTSFSTPFASGMSILFHEGHYRKAIPIQPIPGLYPGVHICTPIEDLIDIYLIDTCVKPQGVLVGKDNDYGFGLLFGPLVAQVLQPVAPFDISTIIQPIMSITMLSMLGMIIKGEGK